MIRDQKWSVILEILWLAYYNPEINWRTGKVQMMRCLEECGKKQITRQIKPEWQKQKEKKEKKQREEKIIQETNSRRRDEDNKSNKRKGRKRRRLD